MRILVVGGGGREHAIVWKFAQSPRVDRIWCAPGNAGIASLAECVPIAARDIGGMVAFARANRPDLVFVAPDDPLALGMVDAMEAAGFRAFGPRRNAAVLEASKIFSKGLMRRYGIPTARYEVFDAPGPALEYLSTHPAPIVVKADGLALGKGVVVARTTQEAEDAVHAMMGAQLFGDAGARIVIEEFLEGPELTVLAFTDGRTVIPMVTSRDHKRAFDGDLGPNTGGMGAVSPGADLSSDAEKHLMDAILQPTVDAMRQEGRLFQGVLYFGLMLTRDGPKVIEYNARFGDPETQAVLPRLETDLVDIVEAVIDRRLHELSIRWSSDATCCVVLASGGYPGHYETGLRITGLEDAAALPDTLVFHAGTRFTEGGTFEKRYETAGGRVLGVTARAGELETAIHRAYDGVSRISFPQMHYRKDIGRTAG
jgi:phosphoribosylamine--glycine ligase